MYMPHYFTLWCMWVLLMPPQLTAAIRMVYVGLPVRLLAPLACVSCTPPSTSVEWVDTMYGSRRIAVICCHDLQALLFPLARDKLSARASSRYLLSVSHDPARATRNTVGVICLMSLGNAIPCLLRPDKVYPSGPMRNACSEFG